MSSEDFMILANDIIAGYVKEELPDDEQEREIPIVPVWLCKTLQNCKGIFVTLPPDGMLFEVTCDGDYSRLYMDVYRKAEHRDIEYIWGEEAMS